MFTAHGWDGECDSVEELWTDDYHTVRPLPLDRLVHHFGTGRPTVEQYTRAIAGRALQDEADMRWTGRFVVLHTDGEPTHLGLFGYSGD